jgi:hypothetical protein
MRLLLSSMCPVVAHIVPAFTRMAFDIAAFPAVAVCAARAAILPTVVFRRDKAGSANGFYLAAITALSAMAPTVFALWRTFSPISVVLINLYYQRRVQRTESDWGKRHGR